MNFSLYFKAFITNFKLFSKKLGESLEFQPLPLRSETLNEDDFNYALSLYGKNSWLLKYAKQLEDTISKILEKRIYKDLFGKMVSKFKYIDSASSNQCVISIADQIINKWKCNCNETILVAVKKVDNLHPDGSFNFLYSLQKELKMWRSDHILTVYDLSFIKRKYTNYNIVLCDDFIGTGGTIEKRIKDIRGIQDPKKKLYVVSIGGMRNSCKNLSNTYKVDFFVPIQLDRKLNPEEDKVVLQIEEKLAECYKRYSLSQMSLGYGKTGALYYNENYRIPNNVYPIFWWGKMKDGSEFNSIFLRT